MMDALMKTQSPTERAIFLAAIEAASPDERVAILDEACGGDTSLRADVELLLAAHERLGTLPSEHESAPTEHTGTRIGPYTLLEQIGAGGFGLVFIADQSAPVRRTVALKVIKPGMDTAHVIARFEAERQALALMDHPNIAKVFDAGVTESRRPYFVMELVRGGESITEYCDRNRLHPSERLELFMYVCDAVQHAHQKGIIHRDLKPSNVLVASHDGKHVVKVIDFGVAKAIGHQLTERSFHTNFAQFIGTPMYMSPEQAELSGLDIDTRSDIYSLGVLLYELLTGTTPFDKKRFAEAPYDEVRRIIREEEPATPSTRLSHAGATLANVAACRKIEPVRLSKLLRGDLDWITMKCLEKDRGRRYQTANALAQDIERFLADEPVSAGPPSRTYRLRKFARRNKGPVLAASLLVLALTGGFAGTAWGWRRALTAEKQAIAERDRANTENQIATEVKDFLRRDLFQLAAAAGQASYQNSGVKVDPDLKVRDLVFRAARQIEGKFADQPLVEAEIREILGWTLHEMGFPDQAIRHQERVRAIYTSELGPDHHDTLRSMNGLAMSYSDLGRYAEAQKLHEETLALRKAKLGSNHIDTLGSMVNLARIYTALGCVDEAVNLYQAALPVMKAKYPDDAFTFICMNNLANSYTALGRNADALKLHEETLPLLKAKRGPDHPDTLLSMNNLAGSYAKVGRQAEAFILREETLALQKAKQGPEHPDTLKSMDSLAESYAALGRLADSLRLHEETLALRRAKLGREHPDTLISMNNLAKSYSHVGRHGEALKLQEETLALRKAKLGSDHPQTLMSMNNLATSYAIVGRHAEALKLLEETLALMKAKLGPEHIDTLGNMVNLAACYGRLGSHADAIRLYHAALPIMKARYPDHRYTFNCMNNLADSYATVGRHAEALKLHEETLALRKAKLGPNHPDTLTSIDNLAESYHALGQHAEALKLREGTLALQKVKLGADHPHTLLSMNSVANSYATLGRYAEALKLREERLALMKAKFGPNYPAIVNTIYDIACTHALMIPKAQDPIKQSEVAMDWLKQAVNAGFNNVEHMKKDTDLDSLRDRADFKKLLAELEANAEMKTKSQPPSASEPKPIPKAEPDKTAEEKLNVINGLQSSEPPPAVDPEVAAVMRDDVKLDESVARLEKLYRERKEKLGQDHPQTLSALRGLGRACFNAGRLDDALKHLEEWWFEANRPFPGPESHVKASVQCDLARVYLAKGNHANAITLFEASYATQKVQLGTDHPATLFTMAKLAEGYRSVGRNADATELMEQCLPKLKDKLGPDHPNTLDTMNELGTIYFQSKQLEMAYTVVKECLDRRIKARPGDWLTGSAQSQLGGVLLAQKKHADAEPLLMAGYECMAKQKEKIPPIEKPRLIEAVSRLVQLYEGLDRKDEAAKWRKELEAIKGAAQNPEGKP